MGCDDAVPWTERAALTGTMSTDPNESGQVAYDLLLYTAFPKVPMPAEITPLPPA